MQDRSVAKRDHILRTTAALFVEHGFEHTTLAMVSKTTGAAIGSITHFFGDKSELAAAVLESVARPLIARVDAALRDHPKDVQAAIGALLAACSDWAIGHPGHPCLIAQLEAGIRKDANPSQGGRPGLTATIAKWAAPLVARKRIRPLSPAHLDAVILAPIFDALRSDPAEAADASTFDWLSAFTEAAIAALIEPARKSQPDRHSAPQAQTKTDTPVLKLAPQGQGSFLLPEEKRLPRNSKSTTRSHVP